MYPAYDQPTHFVINKELGCSKFPVYHLQILPQGSEYALKVFPHTEAAYNAYLRERSVLYTVSHPNVVQCMSDADFKDINSTKCHYLLLEYAPYGDFFSLVKYKGLKNEKVVRTYFHQFIEGLEHLHECQIAHLDIKLENLLLASDFRLKLADFDLSQSIKEKTLLNQGTSCYRSPEVLNEQCKDFFAADVYSAGIILYLFETREFPFLERSKGGIHELIDYDLFQKNNDLFWKKKSTNRKDQPFFSDSFKELINGMLEPDITKRWTLQDVKCCKWYNEATLDNENLKIRMEKTWSNLVAKHAHKKKDW